MKNIFLHIQSRTLNFAISAGAMNRFAPTKVAKFNVRDCIYDLLVYFKKLTSINLDIKHGKSSEIEKLDDSL